MLAGREEENQEQASYTVRGILDTKENLCIVQGNDKSMLFQLLFFIRRKMEKKKNLRAYPLFQMVVPFVWILGIAGLLFLSLRFSDDYIPTAWSDFEFFSTLFREKAEMVFLMLKNEWQLSDIESFYSFFGIIGCSVLWMYLQKTLEKSILRIRKCM